MILQDAVTFAMRRFKEGAHYHRVGSASYPKP